MRGAWARGSGEMSAAKRAKQAIRKAKREGRSFHEVADMAALAASRRVKPFPDPVHGCPPAPMCALHEDCREFPTLARECAGRARPLAP